MGNVIITINRESGSGGREIAHQLGKTLGLSVYDKAILESMAEKIDIEGCPYKPESQKVTSKELFQTETQIMRNLAEKESCIIVGRCGFRVLKDFTNVIKLFIHANRDVRIQRMAKIKKINKQLAAERMDEIDEARESFTKYFGGCSRYDARNYDISIDVSHTTIDAVVAFLAENLQRKMDAVETK